MILDQHGNKIDMAALREPQTSRVRHLHSEWDAHPARGITPAKLQAILVEAEQGDLIRQLELADDIEERDAHVYSELSKRKGSITALEWDLQEPEGASAAEQKTTAQVREWLRGMPDFEDVLLDMMDAVLKGFSMQEMVWSVQQKVLLPTLTFRPQRWFMASADRQSLLLRSHQVTPASEGLAAVQGEPLQPFSWLAHTHRSRSGYVTRNSLCRVLALPYLFKYYAIRDLAEFLEIFGLPLRLGKYPSGATKEEKATLLNAVVSIGHNAAGIIPQGMVLEFQEAAKGTEGPFTSMWDRMEAMESKAIVGQTLTSGEGRNGTQALGQVHNEVRMDIRNADARQIESTLNRQLIYPLVMLNIPGADPRRLPKLRFDTGEAEDLAAYAESLPKLAGAGMRIAVDWAHNKLRIPKAESDDELITAQRPPAVGATQLGAAGGEVEDESLQPGAGRRTPAQREAALSTALAAAVTLRAAPRDALDDIADDALADWRPLLAPMVEPLLQEIDNAVAAGESLLSFRARLPQLVERMDGVPLATKLERAAFAARLAGEADLDISGEEV